MEFVRSFLWPGMTSLNLTSRNGNFSFVGIRTVRVALHYRAMVISSIFVPSNLIHERRVSLPPSLPLWQVFIARLEA